MERRADRCPYERPFRSEFAECPAYLPRLELPTDSLGASLYFRPQLERLLAAFRETGSRMAWLDGPDA